MGAELARKRAGDKTETGMSEQQLREYASKPLKKSSTNGKKTGKKTRTKITVKSGLPKPTNLKMQDPNTSKPNKQPVKNVGVKNSADINSMLKKSFSVLVPEIVKEMEKDIEKSGIDIQKIGPVMAGLLGFGAGKLLSSESAKTKKVNPKKDVDVKKVLPAALTALGSRANAGLTNTIGQTGRDVVVGAGKQAAISEGARKISETLHPDENKMQKSIKKGVGGALAGGAVGNVAGRYLEANPQKLNYQGPNRIVPLSTLAGAGLGSMGQDYLVGKKKKKKLFASQQNEPSPYEEKFEDVPEVEEEEVKSMKKSIKKSSLQKSIDEAIDHAFKKATNVISGDSETASVKPGKKTVSGAQMRDSKDNTYTAGAKPIPVSKCVNEFDNTATNMNRKYSSEVNTKRSKINSGTLQGPKKVKLAGVKPMQKSVNIRKDNIGGRVGEIGNKVADAASGAIVGEGTKVAGRVGSGMADAASKMKPRNAALIGAGIGAATAPKGKRLKRALIGAGLGYGAKLAYDKWGKPTTTTPAATPEPEGGAMDYSPLAPKQPAEQAKAPASAAKVNYEAPKQNLILPGDPQFKSMKKSIKKSVKKSAPISSYPAQQQQAVVSRRIQQPGLGGVSARNAQKIIDAQTKAQALKTLGVSKAVDTYTTNSVPANPGSTTKGIKCKTCGSTDMADNGRHFTCENCGNSFKKSFLTQDNSVLTSTQKKTVRDSKNYHEEINDTLTRKRPEMEKSELDMAKSQASLRVEKAIFFLNGYEPMGDDKVKKSFHGQIPELMSNIETRPPLDWWEKAIKKASVFTEDPVSYATNLWYDINKAVAEPIEGKFNPYRKGEENQISDGTRLDVSDLAGKGKSEITETL